jgi:response regulator RpfG family c-di-GMP phosphodiesterase
MVKAIKEFPFLAIIEVALPKIYGFEVCRRLKARPDTKEMKFILIPAIHDKTKYRREPSSLYGADEYIEEFDIKSHLVEKVSILKEGGAVSGPAAPEKPLTADQPTSTVEPSKPAASEPDKKSPIAQASPNVQPQGAAQPGNDEKVEKAKRLARTIINDIHLYNTAKVDTAIKTGDFYSVFAPELKEGKKLYDSRIPQEIREKFDHYREAIENFIASKKSV